MFVGVLEAHIQNRGLFSAVQTLFKLFLGDAFDGHGAILAMPLNHVKLAVADRRQRLPGRCVRNPIKPMGVGKDVFVRNTVQHDVARSQNCQPKILDCVGT